MTNNNPLLVLSYWYDETTNAATMSDEFLKSIFIDIESSGALQNVFYDKHVTNEEEFVNFIKYGQCVLFVCFDKGRPFGICWLTSFEGRTARLHFYVMTSLWGTDTKPQARYLVRHILNSKTPHGEYLWDLLYGYTQESNTYARKYMEQVGVTVGPTIPYCILNAYTNQSENGVMFWATRDNDFYKEEV